MTGSPSSHRQSLRIAAIVVNYRTADLTLAAVRSLAADLDPDRDGIFVVDNASRDGSVDRLEAEVAARAWGIPIQVIAAPKNGGFSYGNNLGLAAVQAEAYLLLNSDALLERGAVEVMRGGLATNPEIGVVGPMVVGEAGEPEVSCFNDRTPWNELLRSAQTGPITRLLGQIGVREVAIPPGGEPRVVDWVSFACVMIRGEVLRKVGPMDDGYFMYLEDNDYCRRCRENGWRVLYLPTARATHLSKGWSARQTRRQPCFFYESRARYFRTFYGPSGFVLANLAWSAGRMVSATRELLERRPRGVAEKARRDIWTFGCGP